MRIGIIGAGASGMMAALTAAENPKNEIILMERQARVGKKLLATGNGRCNLSNTYADRGGYHGSEPQFSDYARGAFSVQDTLSYFESIGLMTVEEASGKIYPYSDQANSVVDVLRFALQKPNIQLLTGFDVKKVRHTGDGFLVSSDEETISCDRLIVACGGLAGTKLGGSMSGYKILSQFGHKSTRLRPALVQLKTNFEGIAALKGVRANCHITILHDDKIFAQDTGEIQFTDYGISGPVVFQISRDVCYGPGNWSAKMDFIPHMTEEEIFGALCRRRNTELNAEDLLTGILHNRLGKVLARCAGLRDQKKIAELNDGQLRWVATAVKEFTITLTEPMGMDSAQVTAGGILTCDFDDRTMKSKLVPGLFACGEVLDIDGDCGGYNLQWAWSSGRLAGLSAGKENL